MPRWLLKLNYRQKLTFSEGTAGKALNPKPNTVSKVRSKIRLCFAVSGLGVSWLSQGFGGVGWLGAFRLSELLGFGVQSSASGCFKLLQKGPFEQLSHTVLSLNPKPSTLKPLPHLLGCCVGGVALNPKSEALSPKP